MDKKLFADLVKSMRHHNEIIAGTRPLKATELTELGWSNLKSIGGNPAHSFIAIKFDSSQFGVLDESTGDFFPGGQN